MHVFTATSRTQGLRTNDYTATIEGELVRIDEPCASDQEDPDGGCGCGRAFAGMSSCRATTTAVVRDLPLTPADYERAFVDSLVAAQWISVDDLADPEVLAEVHAETEQMISAAGSWPVGTVVERRLNLLKVRAVLDEQPRAS